MQGELRATLIENKRLEDQTKALESELQQVCSEIKEKKAADRANIEKKIKMKFPSLMRRYQGCKTRQEALEVIKFTREMTALLTELETLAKLKYMELFSNETTKGTLTFKTKKSSRKKVVAKRQSQKTSREQGMDSDSTNSIAGRSIVVTQGSSENRDPETGASTLESLIHALARRRDQDNNDLESPV